MGRLEVQVCVVAKVQPGAEHFIMVMNHGGNDEVKIPGSRHLWVSASVDESFETLADAEKWISDECGKDSRWSGARFRIVRVCSDGVVIVENKPKVTLPSRVGDAAVDVTA